MSPARRDEIRLGSWGNPVSLTHSGFGRRRFLSYLGMTIGMLQCVLKGKFVPKQQNLRKAKRTFSLSRQTVAFLESERKTRRERSLSAVLEEIVRQHQEQKEMERVSAAFTRYYDSLTPSEITEDRAWGDFAATQFPDEA